MVGFDCTLGRTCAETTTERGEAAVMAEPDWEVDDKIGHGASQLRLHGDSDWRRGGSVCDGEQRYNRWVGIVHGCRQVVCVLDPTWRDSQHFVSLLVN